MGKIRIIADDFGFSEGVNKACFEAIEANKLNELSLMISCPGSNEAIKGCQEIGFKNIGIHLYLGNINKDGVYHRTSDYEKLLENTDRKIIEQMFDDEIKRFEDEVGFTPKHIIGHQHIHLHPKLINKVIEYATAKECYVRRRSGIRDGEIIEDNSIDSLLINSGVKISELVVAYVKSDYETALRGFQKYIEKAKKENQNLELFFHPAYID